MEGNSEKKKNMGLLFFMRNQYMKCQDSNFNGLKVTVGTKKCDARTQSWGHNYAKKVKLPMVPSECLFLFGLSENGVPMIAAIK